MTYLVTSTLLNLESTYVNYNMICPQAMRPCGRAGFFLCLLNLILCSSSDYHYGVKHVWTNFNGIRSITKQATTDSVPAPRTITIGFSVMPCSYHSNRIIDTISSFSEVLTYAILAVLEAYCPRIKIN